MNKAATIHTPQIVATVTRYAGCEEARTWKGFTVTLYRWMLSTAIDYADRRRQNGRNVRIKSPYTHVSDILFAQASEKNTVK